MMHERAPRHAVWSAWLHWREGGGAGGWGARQPLPKRGDGLSCFVPVLRACEGCLLTSAPSRRTHRAAGDSGDRGTGGRRCHGRHQPPVHVLVRQLHMEVLLDASDVNMTLSDECRCCGLILCHMRTHGAFHCATAGKCRDAAFLLHATALLFLEAAVTASVSKASHNVGSMDNFAMIRC